MVNYGLNIKTRQITLVTLMFNNQLWAPYTGPGMCLIFRGNQPTEKSSPWGVIYSKNTVTGWIHVSESWSPRTPECDLIWRHGLPRGRQVQMRSLGWVLIQHAWHLSQRGNSDTDIHRKGRQYEENPGRRREKTAIHSQGERTEQSFPTASEGTNPADTLFWTLAPRTVRQHIPVV